MKHWIISASETVYDHYKAFDTWGYVDWGVKANMSVGDIVYLYFRSPISRIRCKTEVIKTNLKFDEISEDESFWLNGNKRTYKNRYVRLKLIAKTEDEKLAYSLLKPRGIGNNTLQANYEIKQRELIDYIEASFEQTENNHFDQDDKKSLFQDKSHLSKQQTFELFVSKVKEYGIPAEEKSGGGHNRVRFGKGLGIKKLFTGCSRVGWMSISYDTKEKALFDDMGFESERITTYDEPYEYRTHVDVDRFDEVLGRIRTYLQNGITNWDNNIKTEINTPLKAKRIQMENGRIKLICGNCGYTFTEANRCPECGQLTDF